METKSTSAKTLILSIKQLATYNSLKLSLNIYVGIHPESLDNLIGGNTSLEVIEQRRRDEQDEAREIQMPACLDTTPRLASPSKTVGSTS